MLCKLLLTVLKEAQMFTFDKSMGDFGAADSPGVVLSMCTLPRTMDLPSKSAAT